MTHLKAEFLFETLRDDRVEDYECVRKYILIAYPLPEVCTPHTCMDVCVGMSGYIYKST